VGLQANFISSYSQDVGICLTGHTKTSFIGWGEAWGWAGHPSSGNGDIFHDATSNDPIGPIGDYFENDVLGIALDMDNGKLFVSLNNVWENSGDPVGGTGFIADGISGLYYPAVSLIAATSAVTFNFGAAGPTGTIPTGYTMPDYTPPIYTTLGSLTGKNVIIGG
jgi:hypothetical protein